MSNVTLTIGGRTFTVSCAEGQEAHVAQLGALIDQKATEAGAVGQSETRMLLFAALMLADGLHNAAANAAPPSSEPTVDPSPDLAANLAERLGRIAQRVENLADLLEQDATNA